MTLLFALLGSFRRSFERRSLGRTFCAGLTHFLARASGYPLLLGGNVAIKAHYLRLLLRHLPARLQAAGVGQPLQVLNTGTFIGVILVVGVALLPSSHLAGQRLQRLLKDCANA